MPCWGETLAARLRRKGVGDVDVLLELRSSSGAGVMLGAGVKLGTGVILGAWPGSSGMGSTGSVPGGERPFARLAESWRPPRDILDSTLDTERAWRFDMEELALGGDGAGAGVPVVAVC